MHAADLCRLSQEHRPAGQPKAAWRPVAGRLCVSGPNWGSPTALACPAPAKARRQAHARFRGARPPIRVKPGATHCTSARLRPKPPAFKGGSQGIVAHVLLAHAPEEEARGDLVAEKLGALGFEVRQD